MKPYSSLGYAQQSANIAIAGRALVSVGDVVSPALTQLSHGDCQPAACQPRQRIHYAAVLVPRDLLKHLSSSRYLIGS